MNASSFTQAVFVTALGLLGASGTVNAQYDDDYYEPRRPTVTVDARVHIGSGARPPRYERVRVPLVIVWSPTIVINRYHDGRYYYRNPSGYYYWRGRDNRYYLDESCIQRVRYDDRSYREWKHRGHYYRDGKKHKHHGHGRHRDRGRDRDWDDD